MNENDYMSIQISPKFVPSSPFYLHGLTLILTTISDYTHHKMWDEIIYPFVNFSGE